MLGNDDLSDDLFRDTVGVDISSVPGVQASIVCCFQQWERVFLLQNPRLPVFVTKAHCTEDWNGDSKPTLAQANIARLGVIDGLDDGIVSVVGGHVSSWLAVNVEKMEAREVARNSNRKVCKFVDLPTCFLISYTASSGVLMRGLPVPGYLAGCWNGFSSQEVGVEQVRHEIW